MTLHRTPATARAALLPATNAATTPASIGIQRYRQSTVHREAIGDPVPATPGSSLSTPGPSDAPKTASSTSSPPMSPPAAGPWPTASSTCPSPGPRTANDAAPPKSPTTGSSPRMTNRPGAWCCAPSPRRCPSPGLPRTLPTGRRAASVGCCSRDFGYVLPVPKPQFTAGCSRVDDLFAQAQTKIRTVRCPASCWSTDSLPSPLVGGHTKPVPPGDEEPVVPRNGAIRLPPRGQRRGSVRPW